MKKTLITGLFIMYGIAVIAQDTEKVTLTTDPKVLKMAATTDHAGEWMVVKEGKVYSTSNGKMILITKDLLLDNGSTLKTNGEVITKDGTKILVKEGERINRLGDLAKVPDSTEKKISKAPEAAPVAPVTK